MFSMGISGALWKDILRIAIGWNKSDRPIAMGTAMELLRPPVENDQTSQSFQLPWQIYVFLQNRMKQLPVAFMFLFHGLS